MTSRPLLGVCFAGLATISAAGCATDPLEPGPAGPDPAAPRSDEYVALGDSFASGTGTRDYYDAGCQRSDHAYAKQLAADHGLKLTHAACSGARIPDVRAKQLDALSPATGLVTISIGGNDAGFGNVLGQCAKPWPASCDEDIAQARAFITDTLPGRLGEIYTEIAARASNARVIVVGYPRLFNGEECNLVARISGNEQGELNQVADLLATTIATVAASHGFDFVDTREPFQAHRICDDVEWLNGLSDPIGESYHPNKLGHDAFAALIAAAL